MIGWLIRILLVVAGFITSLFVAQDALNYHVIQMVIAVILFTLLVFLIAFWPKLKNLTKWRKKN